MAPNPESRRADRDRSVRAVAVFSSLMHAHERDDSAGVQNAAEQLTRLGVRVEITSTPSRSETGGGR